VTPDIEKGKKRRRRSARVYLSNAHPLPSPEQLAALVDQFPSDEDDDQSAPPRARRTARPDEVKRDVGQAERRELASEDRALPNLSYPVKTHQDAENALAHIRLGHGDVKEAKRMLRRVAREEGWSDILSALGGKTDKAAMGNAHQPDGRSLTEARVSPSRVQGQASPSVGDHGASAWQDPMTPPTPRQLALGHPDMRSGTTRPVPLFSARTDANPHPRDLSGAAGVGIALSRLDAYSAAGAPGFRQQPSGNPAVRPMDHIASSGPSNGGHGLADTQSHALKASEAREMLKRHMFGGSGPR